MELRGNPNDWPLVDPNASSGVFLGLDDTKGFVRYRTRDIPYSNDATRPSIVLFGDSQTNACGGPGTPGNGIGTYGDGKLDKGFIWYALGKYMKCGPRVVANYGIGGSTVLRHDGLHNPMIDRYTRVFEQNARMVTFLGGTNDIHLYSDADANPISIMNGIIQIVDDFLAAGLEVLFMTSWLKYYASPTASNRASQAKIHALAQYQRNYALSRKGIILIDTEKVLQDLTATELMAGSTVFNDGLHQSNVGARLIGDAMGAKLAAVHPEWINDERPSSPGDHMQSARKLTPSSMVRAGGVVTIAAASNIDAVVGQAMGVYNPNDQTFTGWWTVTSRPNATSFTYNDSQADATPTLTNAFITDIPQLLQNPTFTTTTGGLAPTAPCTGASIPWVANTCINATAGHLSAVIDTIARANNREGDTCGNNVRATITAGASTSNADWYRMTIQLSQFVSSSQYLVSRTLGGDKLRVMLGLNLTGMSNVIGVRASLTWAEDGVSKQTYMLYDDQATNGPYSQADIIDLVLESNEITLLPTLTSFTMSVSVQVSFGAGAGACVAEVGRVGILINGIAHQLPF